MTLRSAAALAAALTCSTALGAAAQGFERVASFPVTRNLAAGADPRTETSAEIVTATGDGMTLAYSDSPRGVVGLIDIADPAKPVAKGAVEMGGEPTSVAALGQTIFAAVNTSESYTAPSGFLALIDAATGTMTRSCDLGGQPDSAAVAPDGSFLAVAVENERDEDVNDGAIPQAPAGFVAIIPLANGMPDCAAMVKADLTGLAAVAPEDPEPEFVSVNGFGEIAVTLQENNHIVVLGRDGKVLAHFSAGAVDLKDVDLVRDGALRFTQAKEGVLREPDAVKWIDGDRLLIANEGDWKGGSRGFSIVSKTGEALWDSGAALEHEAIRHGHYPEGRSRSKGVEPEGAEVARFGDATYMFVLAERASVAGVWRDTGAAPEFVQLLPSGVSPEGAVAIPSRGLLVTANEADLGEDGLARSHVMIYALKDGAPNYPTIVSGDDADGRPVGWGALSGLAADPATPGKLYAVSDSVYGMAPAIYAIDATRTPARITAKTLVTRFGQPAQKLDLEGIAADGQGGFWLASEGRSDRLIPHALYQVDAKGEIKAEIPFPAELAAAETRFGAEGVALADGRLWVAIQREWGDDPKGTVKLLSYDIKEKTWGAVRYPLEPKGEGWMGLSEIAIHDGFAYVVERDNLIGEAAVVKRLYRVPMAQMVPVKLGGELPVVSKELVRDFLPDLARWGGYAQDKIEGFAIDAAGTAFVVTDNDGVDDASGETLFWSIGGL
jgi:Esterase-like activity of phytase